MLPPLSVLLNLQRPENCGSFADPSRFLPFSFSRCWSRQKENINGTVIVVIGRRPPIRRIRFAGKQTSLVFVLLGLGGDGSSNEITRDRGGLLPAKGISARKDEKIAITKKVRTVSGGNREMEGYWLFNQSPSIFWPCCGIVAPKWQRCHRRVGFS